MRNRPTGSPKAVVGLMLAGALPITACGEDDSGETSEPQKLAVEVTQRGKDKFRLSAPRAVEAGMVEISLSSPATKATTHDAQLIRVEGDHAADEVVKAIARGEGAPMPRWLSPAGGVGQTGAGLQVRQSSS